jgi:hypothetical protein
MVKQMDFWTGKQTPMGIVKVRRLEKPMDLRWERRMQKEIGLD